MYLEKALHAVSSPEVHAQCHETEKAHLIVTIMKTAEKDPIGYVSNKSESFNYILEEMRVGS